MFSFFKSKKQNKDKALADFNAKIMAEPGGNDLLYIFKRKTISDRVEVLIDTGNKDQVGGFVEKQLKENFSLWEKTNDPVQLHRIAEVYRVAHMPEKCFTLLQKTAVKFGSYSTIDMTWLWLDLGLAAHECRKEPLMILKCFEASIKAIAPPNAPVVVGEEIKIGAAYCGFILSGVYDNPEKKSLFHEYLSQKCPEVDWYDYDQCKEYSKELSAKFIGLSDIELTPNSQQDNQEREQSQSGDIGDGALSYFPQNGEKFVFHQVVETCAENEGFHGFEIAAEAYIVRDSDGTINYGIQTREKESMLPTDKLIEIKAARCWRKLFDNNEITKEQAITWLQQAKDATDCPALFYKTNDMHVMCSLCYASLLMHFTKAQKNLDVGADIENPIEAMPDNEYVRQSAARLRAAIQEEKIDKNFIALLELTLN